MPPYPLVFSTFRGVIFLSVRTPSKPHATPLYYWFSAFKIFEQSFLTFEYVGEDLGCTSIISSVIYWQIEDMVKVKFQFVS